MAFLWSGLIAILTHSLTLVKFRNFRCTAWMDLLFS